jgi:hypothetical protein
MDDQKYIGNNKDLHEAMMDTTVSCTGKTITIACGSHDSKDFLLDYLTGAEPKTSSNT